MALEEPVRVAARLDELRREERALLFELAGWWAVRRSRYALTGPVASGQERTLDLVREMVRVLAADSEEVRDLRWAVLERVARANGEELRQLAGCTASVSTAGQEKVLPGQGSDVSGYRGEDALEKRCDTKQGDASHPFPFRTRK